MNNERQQIIQALAKFKADLLWDDIVGIFDLIPQEVKKQIEDYYKDAILGAANKLNISLETLEQEVEEIAYSRINGQSYSQAEIEARLKEYGISSFESHND